MNQPVSESKSGSLLSYTIGYGLSLGLTGTAFWLAHKHVQSHHITPSDNFMLIALAALAVIQLAVQLVFFFHLDRESKPRWNSLVLGFAAMVVAILVGGSIWIMTNLGYHHPGNNHYHQTPSQLNQSIIKDEGVQP